jgi:CubicO group peptidase (beta-lactamase class C family)
MLKIIRPFAICLMLLWVFDARADKVDAFIEGLLEKRHIAGLSLAIIENGTIVKASGYGFADNAAKVPVTTNTLFQAGSISKPVSALGALHLVESNKLSLDEDVNAKLRTWQVPENEFTKLEKVTLRRILSHNAGLTVHGFPGYALDEPLPTLVQVLDGASPANTKPIRVDVPPGSKVRYSGGGFTVMQQWVIDVSGEPFPNFMSNVVLAPLRMSASTFQQPLPKETSAACARGYYPNGKPVKGGWHVYPEMAAAGLWTTAADLARYAVAVQQMLAGKGAPVISKDLTREMLSPQKESVGLGLALERSGKSLRFKHGGRDEGFDALLVAYAEAGQGAVLMINSNDNTGALERIVELIAREYKWPDYP